MLNKSLEDLHWGYDSMAFFFFKCILLLLFLMFQVWSEDHRLQNYLINKNLGAKSNKAHFKINFQVILLYVKVGVVSYSWLRNKHLASLLGHFVPSQEYRCYYWLLN